MPRYNRRRPSGAELPPGAGGAPERVDTWRGAEWAVRSVTGSAATKAYRCPGCDQEIRPVTPHVVVWPTDSGLGERRHWHTACWRARETRGPR